MCDLVGNPEDRHSLEDQFVVAGVDNIISESATTKCHGHTDCLLDFNCFKTLVEIMIQTVLIRLIINILYHFVP